MQWCANELDDAVSSLLRNHPFSGSKIHALALPFPAQGHINPMMHLCEKLSARGLAITFVNTEHNHRRMLESQARAGPVALRSIRLVGIPDGLPDGHPRTGDLVELSQATEAMVDVFEQLVEKLLAATPPLSVIISDAIVPCAQLVASKFGLPRVALRTTNASMQALYYHLPQLISDGVLPFRGGKEIALSAGKSFLSVPGLPPLHPSSLPSFLLDDHTSGYFLDFALRILDTSIRADWLLVNSFQDLESRSLNSMQTKHPVYTVGPLLPLHSKDDEQRDGVGTALWKEDADCLQWLNTQPASSVVYVAFGSIATLSPAQVEELRLGLEASGQNFLWVYRPDLVSGVDLPLLEDFSSRMKERGRIVAWAPQLLVLSNPSVGAFISHCGWNSCLESISLGVPILAWPSFAEQKLNATFVVEEWKVGMDFVAGPDGIVGREEVERVVRAAMVGERGRELRIRSGKLKEAAMKAVAEGGSSHMNLEAIVEDLERRMKTR